MSAKGWARAQQRSEEQAAARTVCVALVDGNTVKSIHANHKEANTALCTALDSFFEANPSAQGHALEVVPLSTVPTVGTKLDHATRV